MGPPYILTPVNDNGDIPAFKISRSLRKRGGVHRLVIAVALEEAYSTIETAGVQGIPDTIGNDTIFFEFVGRYCIAHAQNPTNPDEIYVLITFDLRDNYATGRDEAWRLWRKQLSVQKS